MSTDDYMLCYVDEPWAWFANVPPAQVWGDDWDDAPHDCNADTPYARDGQRLMKVAYDAGLEVVGVHDRGEGVGRWGHLSVEDLNARRAPWLAEVLYGSRGDDGLIPLGVQVWAGVTLAEFRELIAGLDGHVYEASRG